MKKLTVVILSFVLTFQIFFIPTAHANLWLLDRNWEKSQKQSQYNDLINKYGYDDDKDANAFCNKIADRLLQEIQKKNKVDLEYSVFVIKPKTPNAMAGLGGNIAVTRGMVDLLQGDEDEMAAIMAHEFGHSVGAHLLDSINGQLWMAVLFDQYLRSNQNTISQVGSVIAFQQISTKGFGRSHEWAADNFAIKTTAAAGYNPAGIAGSFQRIMEKYGERQVTILGELLSPDEHPTNKERIDNNMKFVTEYSGNIVTIHNDWILLYNKAVIKPEAAAGKSSKERMYLIAGNLSQALHAGIKEPAQYKDNQIKMGSYSIMTVTENDTDGNLLAQQINTVLGR